MNKCKTAGNNWSTNVKRFLKMDLLNNTPNYLLSHCWKIYAKRMGGRTRTNFVFICQHSVNTRSKTSSDPSQIFLKNSHAFCRLRKNLKEAEVCSRSERFRAREALLSSLSLYTYNQPQRTPNFGKTYKNVSSHLTVIRVTIFSWYDSFSSVI